MSDTKPNVTLREITKETLRDILRLKVAPHQEHFVAPNAISIAEAHFYPDVAWFRAVYAGDTPVGFAMLEEDLGKPHYYLWRFMIDAEHQHKGYGWQALERICEHVRTRPGGTTLYLSCVPGEGGPGPFYEKFGFQYTGEEDSGELIMRLAL